MRILVVDDEAAICEMLMVVLEGVGMSVRTAGSVAEARQALEEEAFDWVSLDMRLRDGNGLDLLRELPTSNPTAQAIVLSGNGDEPAVRRRAFDDGAAEVFAKPVSVIKLADFFHRRAEAAMPQAV